MHLWGIRAHVPWLSSRQSAYYSSHRYSKSGNAVCVCVAGRHFLQFEASLQRLLFARHITEAWQEMSKQGLGPVTQMAGRMQRFGSNSLSCWF